MGESLMRLMSRSSSLTMSDSVAVRSFAMSSINDACGKFKALFAIGAQFRDFELLKIQRVKTKCLGCILRCLAQFREFILSCLAEALDV